MTELARFASGTVAPLVARAHSAPSGVVTVAQLRARHGEPAAPPRQADSPSAVSVGSLLRREGRAPHAVDRPLIPRQRDRAAAVDVAEPEDAVLVRPSVRRAALATGALIAVGSAFGAAVLTDAEGPDRGGSDRLGTGGSSTPGQAAPGGTGSATSLFALPGDPNGIGALDAGTAGTAGTAGITAFGPAPTPWMTVAFPTAGFGPASSGPTASAPASGTVTAPSTRSPAAPGAGAPVTAGAPRGAAPPAGAPAAPTPTAAAPTPEPAESGPAAAGPVRTLTEPVTGTVEGAGTGLGGPVGGVVGGLGGAVDDTAGTVDGLLG